ncbi:MAG: GGDEF domain-containing protein [Janthinobacterium lividum]
MLNLRKIPKAPPADELQLFHEVARALTSNLELEPLLRTVLGKMEEYFGPERWSLLMIDEETNELYYALTTSSAGLPPAQVRLRMGEGIAGYVAFTGEPLVIPDVRLDREWLRFARQHPELNLQSIACLPLRHGTRTLGVLQLHNSKLDLLPGSSLSFLRVLCDYAAIALQNARQVDLVHRLSITDDCTGLYNSRYLYTTLEAEIAVAAAGSSRGSQEHFSLLFFDLDRFKSVNDTHGHLVGSRLLAEAGVLVKRTLGPGSMAFRYGGDEFVALLRGLDKPEAAAAAGALRDRLRSTPLLTAENINLHITASFGLATFPQDGDNLHDIIRAADTMMYCAKADGRDRLVVASIDRAADMPRPHTSRHT